MPKKRKSCPTCHGKGFIYPGCGVHGAHCIECVCTDWFLSSMMLHQLRCRVAIMAHLEETGFFGPNGMRK